MTWLRTALAILACTSALSSCGGGDGNQASNGSGVGTGGTGSYANGPVTAFGSIVVNGIHFEPEQAGIAKIDAPGMLLPASALQLGMMVEVEASPLMPAEGKTVAKASHITISNQLVGQIANLAGQGFTVMGQPVQVDAATRMDATSLPQGLASLHNGDMVEVYGFHDVRTDSFVATRLVKLDASAINGDWVLQGVVSELDVAAKRCRIGHQVVYSFVDGLPPDLRNGQTLRVRFRLDDSGAFPTGSTGHDTNPENWYASSVTLVSPQPEGLRDAALDGLVSDIDQAPGKRRFRVNGVAVDASTLASCPVCDGLEPGDRVAVRGTLDKGTVSAQSVARP